MSVASLRRRVNALSRQLIVPLGVVRLRPIAEKYCDEWAYATSEGSAPPPCSYADVIPAQAGIQTPVYRRTQQPTASPPPFPRRREPKLPSIVQTNHSGKRSPFNSRQFQNFCALRALCV